MAIPKLNLTPAQINPKWFQDAQIKKADYYTKLTFLTVLCLAGEHGEFAGTEDDILRTSKFLLKQDLTLILDGKAGQRWKDT